MDDATVDADLFGDPTPNHLSDQLLGNEEARLEEEAAAAELRRASESQNQFSEPQWRTSRRLVRTEFSEPIDLRTLEYITEVDEHLYCPICHSPLVSPVALKCEHQFCDECLRSALDSQGDRGKTCPACRGVTAVSCIGPAPKVVTRMLDDVKVRCPLRERGCVEILQRGVVQNHVDLYCWFGETDCSAEDCELKIQRRFAHLPCLHGLVACPNCNQEVMEKDLHHHQRGVCEASYSKCHDCTEWFPLSKIEEHALECPEAQATCTAAAYGCDFTVKRKSMPAHLTTCPLNKLTPFLEKQQARLNEHEVALSHFRRKTTIYEEGLANVQSTLHNALPHPPTPSEPNGSTTDSPFDTSAQLLELHDSVQNEIGHIKQSIADLDAKMEMTVLNQTLRANEEKLHRDAIEGQIRKQLSWLLSSKLQSQQRNTMMRSGSEAGPSVLKNGPPGGSGVGTVSGTSSDEEGERWGPRRRSSESARQETKL